MRVVLGSVLTMTNRRPSVSECHLRPYGTGPDGIHRRGGQGQWLPPHQIPVNSSSWITAPSASSCFFVYDSSYAAILTISFPTLYTHPFFLSFSFVLPWFLVWFLVHCCLRPAFLKLICSSAGHQDTHEYQHITPGCPDKTARMALFDGRKNSYIHYTVRCRAFSVL